MNTVEWNQLSSQADAERLLANLGGFHDSCLREAHVWSEHYVHPDLRMHCSGNLDTRVRLLIQRQFNNPSAVELLFEQVTAFHLQPSPENYDSIIFEATLLHKDDTFYWADTGNWSPTSATRDSATWIAGRKMSWRDASNWMGKQLRYGSQDLTDLAEDT